MARDYYAEALNIAQLLEADELMAEAQAIRDAISSGSTGTEILMALRWHLQRLDKELPQMRPKMRDQIRDLTSAISSGLVG